MWHTLTWAAPWFVALSMLRRAGWGHLTTLTWGPGGSVVQCLASGIQVASFILADNRFLV